MDEVHQMGGDSTERKKVKHKMYIFRELEKYRIRNIIGRIGSLVRECYRH